MKQLSFMSARESVLQEIQQVLSRVDEKEVAKMVDALLGARRIVTCGAGRVGMTTRAFAMRLGHLGLSAWMLGDATVPGISSGDVLLVASGSGETQTIVDLVSIAKKSNAMVVLVTGNRESRMGKMADIIVQLQAPSKVKEVEGLLSIQPMTTLNEQSLFLFFDTVVLLMMQKMKKTHDDMWAVHSNLE